jgi:hypothetical protein
MMHGHNQEHDRADKKVTTSDFQGHQVDLLRDTAVATLYLAMGLHWHASTLSRADCKDQWASCSTT